MHTFTESWDVWEMHPVGSEVVLCTAGAITLHQEHADGTTVEVALGPGEYAVFVVGSDGSLEMRAVEVGLMDYANAEIISGLELGEEVSTGIVETN